MSTPIAYLFGIAYIQPMEKEPLTETLTFRFSVEQRATMQKAANAMGLPLTTFIRIAALEAARKQKGD